MGSLIETWEVSMLLFFLDLDLMEMLGLLWRVEEWTGIWGIDCCVTSLFENLAFIWCCDSCPVVYCVPVVIMDMWDAFF